ncbi:PAS domain-containing protein [Candidatus Sodalis sp. SoCistrobi]|uniref:PAS domain-containing protein n=1 Tax=Candidatus Sodalis sp. SoCistrobi TaxID=1922216 RepID=UPI00093BAA52|nr:PAS domain-containing protein [Candidatus Sodalis sp. SoCistrobi]
MEQHDKGLSAALTRETLNQLPLLALMENAPLPWALKSHDSRYVYINQAGQDFANIPVGFDFEGRLDGEFPTPWAEFAADYQAHDRKAQASPEGIGIYTSGRRLKSNSR